MIIDGTNPHGPGAEPDPSLVKLLVKVHVLQEKLIQCDDSSLADIAQREGVTGSYYTRVLRLGFLAPEIVKAILDGRQPPELTAARLLRKSRLPPDWQRQRTTLGFA